MRVMCRPAGVIQGPPEYTRVMQDACEICVKLVKKMVANTLSLLAHFRAKAAALLLPAVKDLFIARNQELICVAHHL